MGTDNKNQGILARFMPRDTLRKILAAFKYLLPYITVHRFKMIAVVVAMVLSMVISLAMGFGLRYAIDGVPDNAAEGMAYLDTILIFVVALFVISALVDFITEFSLKKIATKVTEHIRCDIFSNVINHNIAYIERQSSGEIQTRIVSDTTAVGRFLTMQVPVIIQTLLSLFAGIAGALFISAELTLVVLLGAPFVFLPFLVYAKRLRILGVKVQSAIAEMGRYSGEAFRNVKVMKAYNKEEHGKQNFSRHAAATTDYTVSSIKVSLLLKSTVGTLAAIASAFLIWYCAKNIYKGTITMGEVVAFAFFANMIVKAVGQFANLFSAFNIIVGKAEKVIEFLQSERYSWPSMVKDFNPSGNIEFHNVHFNYPNRPNVPVLKGVGFKIKAGSQVAIVGHSGAGKSTIFDLLLQLYELQHGSIFIDGINTKDLSPQQLRECIGYVPQKESLISGTVFENISYGSKNADEDSVREAAIKAHADDFIAKLPNGYHTDLGEVGDRLSGGQKQRIALARALIRNPQILLLDEANSALDAESDRHVSEAIKQWATTENKTVLTIAHRLSTASRADQIIVVEDGQIVGNGTSDELTANCEAYNNLSFVMAEPTPSVQEPVLEPAG